MSMIYAGLVVWSSTRTPLREFCTPHIDHGNGPVPSFLAMMAQELVVLGQGGG